MAVGIKDTDPDRGDSHDLPPPLSIITQQKNVTSA